MKKLLPTFVASILCTTALLGAVACDDTPQNKDVPPEDGRYTVYAPDGAPALALCNAMEQNSQNFVYQIVDSSTIQTFVTGESPKADYCVLPVNLASKLLGTGESYQMLGTVTNGNLYFLTTDGELLTKENLSSLKGKTVGVVQLANVPGLTLQVTLNEYQIAYQTIANLEAERAQDKVNLLAVNPTDVTPAYGCDYYLCPEPAATTKINGTQGKLSLAGNLQTLYGGEEGYPQAVIVAKKSVVEKQETEELMDYLEGSAQFLQTATPEKILSLLADKRTEGMSPAFNANNLNATVIANCSVRFTAAMQCKTQVNAFLDKLIAVKPAAASVVSDGFYYGG